MKERKLVMIRHAKSSWSNPLQSDFERPLNERGEQDAPMMGERLKKLGLIPDLVISSPAKRAKQTAKRVAAAVGYDKDKIIYVDKLYHCIPAVFEEVIVELEEKYETVFIVAHNPGITDFINEVSDKFRTDNVPTCGIAGIRFNADQWFDYKMEPKQVFFYDYPKNINGIK